MYIVQQSVSAWLFWLHSLSLHQKHSNTVCAAPPLKQMFEELPIENIAVGTNIAVFLKSPRTSISPHETGKGTPDRRKGVLA